MPNVKDKVKISKLFIKRKIYNINYLSILFLDIKLLSEIES
jgi:hypothetical protein